MLAKVLLYVNYRPLDGLLGKLYEIEVEVVTKTPRKRIEVDIIFCTAKVLRV